jgi:hypothetical protein
MKNRLYVLGFAALLLMGTLGKAHAQSPSAAPAAPGAMAVTPGVAPSCSASVPGLESLDLTPNPALKAVTCGSCSHSPCVGLAPNAACYYLAGGTYHLAKCVINSWCSEDSKPYCDCTNNPPQ